MTKASNTYRPDDRNIKILPRVDYKTVLVIIDKPEQINHNLFHQLFPHAEFSFLSNRTEKEDNSNGFNYTCHKKDFFFKKLKNDRLANLLNKSFDLLIDLNETNTKLMYFTENIEAGLKMGCFNQPYNFQFDMLVEPSSEIANIIKTMVKQIDVLTQTLNKN